MRKSVLAAIAAGVAVVVSWPAGQAAPSEFNGRFAGHARGGEPVSRIIVGLRAEPGAARVQASSNDRMRALSARSGLKFRAGPAIGPAMRVVELESPVSGAELADTLARIAGDPAVAFAEPDQRVYRHAVADDALFPNQWYLQGVEVSALNAAAAWDVTAGSAGVVVAVLDTGVRFDHPDLLQAGPGRDGRLLPGFDFVGPDPGGGFRVANDGDGWDDNPSDPGDWVNSSDLNASVFAGCDVTTSSWHGTRVAGMIGAISNNGVGVAGATWNGWILPVRVLGKCFGENSDILQGMRWAAGLHVDGVADNPYPAKILNMSLGAPGSCTAGYQTVLEELADSGVLVVASAGNSTGGPVEFPANCPGVAGVAGLRHVGTKVGFSSIGPEVALSAPGGNCVNIAAGTPCLYSLDTTVNTGTTVAVASAYTDQFDINVGTSFSAPSVAAIAALMLGVNGNVRGGRLIARLQEGARPFPPAPAGVDACHVPVNEFDTQLECACTATTCGAGMADALASVAAARRPVVAIAVPASVSPGQNVVLDASASGAACGRSIASYIWSGPVPISGADTAVATVVGPPGGSFTLELTVTDDQGEQDAAEVVVTSRTATTTAPVIPGTTSCPLDIAPTDPGPFVDDGPVPQAQSSGGGGGGAFGWADLLLLGLASGVRQLRRSAPRAA